MRWFAVTGGGFGDFDLMDIFRADVKGLLGKATAWGD
jgi:hypothetical protein